MIKICKVAVITFLILSVSMTLLWIHSSNFENPPNYEATAEVLWISDGDTVGVRILEMEESFATVDPGEDIVRFAGMDTEEIHREDAVSEHPDVKGLTQEEYEETEYYARALRSKRIVESLVPKGTRVYLDIDEGLKGGNCRGYFGRLIAVVYTKYENRWINVNARVLAQEYSISNDKDYGLMTDYPSEFDPNDWLSEDYPYV